MATIETKVLTGSAPFIQLRFIQNTQAQITSILRSDKNGASRVRADYPLPANTSIVDYEAAYGASSYTATFADGTTAETTASILQSLPSLHQILNPALNIEVDSITAVSQSRETGNLIQDGLLSHFPFVTFGRAKSRSLALTVVCDSFAKAVEVESIAIHKGVFMLRQAEHVGLDAYLVLEHVRILAAEPNLDRTVWEVEIIAREVRRPQGLPTSAVGNTYQDHLDDFATYFDSSNALPSYAERIAGYANE